MEEQLHQADYDSQYEDEQEDEEYEEEDSLPEHNNTILTALIQLLIQKGVITEAEIDAMVEKVDNEEPEDEQEQYSA